MKRYLHNLSDYRLLTGDMMKLYPIGLVEALPNDTMEQVSNALIRLSPLAAPIYHPVTARIHHFFVPHRLSWGWLANDCGNSWEEFITGGKDGNNADTVPTITTTGAAKDLLDYFGIPLVSGISISALPIAAFNLIYNEFYRDQDLTTERTDKDLTVPNIAWEKDYFTAARPWPQKGPEITLPITGNAPVRTDVASNASLTLGIGYSDKTAAMQSSGSQVTTTGVGSSTGAELYADLSQSTAASINDVRRAFALQRFQEARARYGSRYTEYLRYLGVRNPSDARLRRPEFLGGGRVRIGISEVLQTAPEGTDPRFGVGDLYGHGVGAVRSNRWRRYFEEHGYVISLLSVRPKAIYTTAINRTWLRKDKEDFYQKELEFIGQQPIMNNEIYADATSGDNTFGFADRYREYRENPSLVTGEFRTTLNYWHMAREFTSAPSLNSAFITEDATKRIYNEQTADSLWIMVQNRRAARRVLSKSAYGKII